MACRFTGCIVFFKIIDIVLNAAFSFSGFISLILSNPQGATLCLSRIKYLLED